VLDGAPLYDRLLAPTRIYVKPVLALLQTVEVHGIAHITGGGLLENIPRVVPEGLEVILHRSRWPQDAVFTWLQRTGAIPDAELYRTFNCGIGMTICVPAAQADTALASLEAAGAPAMLIGEVRSGTRGVVIEA
jgi:phosphoribosylformylglycinamidine cyclo-ligase